MNNKLDIPAGSLRIQRESLEFCPGSTLDPRSLFDSHNYQFLLRLHLSGIIHLDVQLRRNHSTSRRLRPLQQRPFAKTPASTLDTTQRHDFLIHEVSYAVRLSQRSECFSTPISLRAIMNSDGISAYQSQQ